MIPFTFFISIIVIILLIISIIKKIYALGMISAMAMIVIGVNVLASGIQGIDNILTLGLGIIFVCLGIYLFLNGSLEQIEKM